MRSMFKASVAALGLAAISAGGAFAGSHSLSGDLKIFLDTSNPAPRATRRPTRDGAATPPCGSRRRPPCR